MAINKLVSIKVPVLDALDDMGIDHSKNTPTLIRWAARAEKEIGSYYSLKRQIAVIKVDKYRAELPCEAMYVQRVLLGNHSKNTFDLFELYCTTTGFTTFTQTDTFLVVDNPGQGTDVAVGNLKWEVQDNHIILSNNFDKQYLTVQYLGLCMDEDGFPKVCENHVEAIVEYIMYRFAKRSRFSPNKMDLGDVVDMRRQWGILAAEARAMDAEISESDQMEIAQLVNDPISGGVGVEVDVHNRDEY